MLPEVKMMLPEVNIWGLGILGYDSGVLPEVNVPDGVKTRVGAGESRLGERRPHLHRILNYFLVFVSSFFSLQFLEGP